MQIFKINAQTGLIAKLQNFFAQKLLIELHLALIFYLNYIEFNSKFWENLARFEVRKGQKQAHYCSNISF